MAVAAAAAAHFRQTAVYTQSDHFPPAAQLVVFVLVFITTSPRLGTLSIIEGGCALLTNITFLWSTGRGTLTQRLHKTFLPVLLLAPGTMALLTVAVLFLAPVAEHASPSMWWAMHLSTKTVLPIATAAVQAENMSLALHRMLIDVRPKHGLERSSVIQAFSALLGTWLGVLPMPLDWGKCWQEWPISCFAGGQIGHFIGLMIAMVVSRAEISSPTKSNTQGQHIT